MFNKILSILSFIVFGLAIRYFYLNNPSESETPFVICMSKKISNIDCPGCGGQRAFHQLLNGNFIEASEVLAKHDENYIPKELADDMGEKHEKPSYSKEQLDSQKNK